MENELNIVTGAFGYTGSHITKRLLAMGKRVRTLTGHPSSDNVVEAAPYDFDRPDELRKSLEGATTLYNTYWIRFAYRGMTHEKAVENSRVLIRAARDAGVKKIVHTSITNPDIDSPYPYYKGKAEVEKAIVESGMSYAILRPNVLFGDQGILINNIAWMLRRFPIFTVPGDGNYLMQPMFVEDYADLAVEVGQKEENIVLDAVGPEAFTFNEWLKIIADTIDKHPVIVHLPPNAALFLATMAGLMVRDVILTREEVGGLLDNLLVSKDPPTGHTKLTGWLAENREWIGRRYMSEVAKHFR